MKKIRIFIALILFTLANASIFAASAQETREKFIDCAKRYLGTPYKYGGTTSAGFDCSGFVYTAAKDAGLKNLPRTSSAMFSYCTTIDSSERLAGDLVFFKDGGSISHVAIYLGNNKIIHCASEGTNTGVIISKLTETYWKNHFYAYGRFISTTQGLADADNIFNDDERVAVVPKQDPKQKTSDKSKNTPKKDTKTSTTTTTTKDTTKTTSTSSGSGIDLKKYGDIVLSGYFDWTLYNPDAIQFNALGVTGSIEYKTHNLEINPGIMCRFIIAPQNDDFSIPCCLTLNFDQNFELYGGIIFTSKTDYIDKNYIPGYFGMTLKSQKLNIGSFKFNIVQDINYVYLDKAFDSLPIFQAVAQSTTFSTGIMITLK